MAQIHPGDKVTEILAGNMLPPAMCTLCGVGSYDPNKIFLDIQTDIEWHGKLYFCLDCARQIGRATGQEDLNTFSTLASANLVLVNRVRELEDQLNKLGEVVEHDILRLVLNRNDPNASSVSVFSDEVSEPTVTSDDLYERYLDSDSSDESSATTGESDSGTESTESTPIDGPDDVNEPTGSDPDKFRSSIEL